MSEILEALKAKREEINCDVKYYLESYKKSKDRLDFIDELIEEYTEDEETEVENNESNGATSL